MSTALTTGPFAAALALATGIAAEPWLTPAAIPGWMPWVLAAAAIAGSVRYRPMILVAVALAGVGRGAGVGGSTSARGVALGLGAHADRFTGVVSRPVLPSRHGTGAALELDAHGDELDNVGSALWVWSPVPLQPGERVAVSGVPRKSGGLRNPGSPPRSNPAGTPYELPATTVQRLEDRPDLVDHAWRLAAASQRRWATAIDEAGGAPDARAALRGIATGDRSAIPEALDERWRASGVYHALSVSGLHLAAVAGLVFAVLRRLVAGSPWGGRTQPDRWAAPPALLVAIAYTMITGAQLATLRALIVIAIVLVAAVLARPIRLLDAVGVAALVLLAARPHDLFDPSFQLSFVAALTLALRASPGPPPDANVAHRVGAWLRRVLSASLWITITTAPITAFHFQQICPGGVIGNVVLTPVVELFALPIALGGLALDATWLLAAATWLVGVVDTGAGWLASVAWVGRVGVVAAGMLVMLVAVAIWLASRRSRTRADVLAWAVLCVGWTFARTPPPSNGLRVTFVDVGQGDAAVVELPDGAVWLVDAGGHPSARDPNAASAPGRAIDRLLTAYGHHAIELAIVSHPHPDHYLGLLAIRAPVQELWSVRELEPAIAGRSRLGPTAFGRVASAMTTSGTRHAHPPLGVARRQAGVELVVHAPRYQPTPEAAWIEAGDPVRSVNDNSLVISIRFRDRTILFTGDIEREGEGALVASGLGRFDVVKIPHHGSRTSSSSRLVEATQPTIAVISCGADNAFGFPAAEVVERWHSGGATVHRTDQDGAIIVTIDHAGQLSVDRFGAAAP